MGAQPIRGETEGLCARSAHSVQGCIGQVNAAVVARAWGKMTWQMLIRPGTYPMKASNIGLFIVLGGFAYLGWILHDMASPGSGDGAEHSLAIVKTATVPVLVEFYAEWCGPCREVGPVVEELAEELAGQARVVRIDVDKSRADVSTCKIDAIPTFIVFKGGQEVRRHTGAMPKQAMIELLEL